MKFLLDMNLPRALCQVIRQLGYECRHAADAGLASASDEQIVQEALAAKEIILTHDLDYARIVAFSGKSEPSVIILRLSKPSLPALSQRFQETLLLAQPDLEQGAIVSVEESAIRIRRLPVR